jgi:iron complex transport system ATP-binding protein
LISLKGLKCNFGQKVIFEDINLDIKNHISILGANGSGKSTLVKAICSLIEYEGEIYIDLKDIQKHSLIQRAKNVSYIPAKLDIYDSFISVEEFVLLGRFAYKKNFFDYSLDDKKIVADTLKFLKIEHLKRSCVSSLSSGEQQLTLIAQALTQQSKIIIFDEPTANLDPHNSRIIAKHIKGLKKYHQIILITHDLHLAYYIDSPVIFVKDKEILFYKNNFFDDNILEDLYGVKFNSLVAQYD